MSEERCSNTPGCCGSEMTRREFIRVAALTGAAFSLFGRSAPAVASPDHKLTEAELERWMDAVMGPARPLVYTPRKNPLAAVPFGGIGCGNVYVGVDGALRDWLIFNNVQPVQLENTFFAVRCKGASTPVVTRVLQTREIPGVETSLLINDISLTGEYPQATLSYIDPGLPVSITLDAVTPMIPLDARASALPAVRFDFKVNNGSDEAQEVALLFAAQNGAGMGSFGGNVNRMEQSGLLKSVVMGIQPGAEPSLDGPLQILTTAQGFEPTTAEKPDGLKVTFTTPGSLKNAATDTENSERAVFWLDEPHLLDTPASGAIASAVSEGAHLVVSGGASLMNALGASASGQTSRPDIVLDDFESGDFHKWQVSGNAFGAAPQTGTLAFQNPVSGWQGKYLVNSFNNGDGTTGRMVSQPFAIRRRFLSFLIGGGSFSGSTCINLVVQGRTVRTRAGRDDERLERASWDVSGLQGQQAHLEIIDQQTGPWGHVNIDDIRQTDSPEAVLEPGALKTLRQLLPTGAFAVQESVESASARLDLASFSGELKVFGVYDSAGLKLPETARILAQSEDGQALVVTQPYGKGSVTVVMGSLWGQAERTPANRQQALRFLAALAGRRYVPGEGTQKTDPAFGEIAISTDASGASALPLFQSADQILAMFHALGALPSGRPGEQTTPSPSGETSNAALAASVTVPGGEQKTVSFYLTWRFPNYWFQGRLIGNRYASFWKDAVTVAEVVSSEATFQQGTASYHKAVYQSSLPYWLIDCLTSQSSTIRSEVCVWTAQDAFAGYEGSGGCCPMNCTHVWGYEQTLAHLFPDLERRMRNADFKRQQNPDGGVNNRISLPVLDHPTGERPFADGQASSVLKAYREHRNSSDGEFLKGYWPDIRKAVEYLISMDGPGPDGVIEGEQWNTYDCQVSGANSFIGGYYLAALRAGEEMAKEMDQMADARRWRSIFESGQRKLVELCWRGDYFVQNFSGYEQTPTQYGPGCLSDQLIGQWWAHQLGLGYVLPQKLVRDALGSIFKYNWRTDFSDFKHSQRVFADGHDKGLLNCTWPHGGRPESPILYCDEVWTGVEYQVAAHMIYEGMVSQGMAVVAGARERYDGARRNPWNELECGGHYARAMSNWSILLAASGFLYHGPRGELTFAPRLHPESFKSFFSTSQGWGSFAQKRQPGLQTGNVYLAHGTLRLRTLTLDLPKGVRLVSGEATIGGKRIGKTSEAGGRAVTTFTPEITLQTNQTLSVRLRLSS